MDSKGDQGRRWSDSEREYMASFEVIRVEETQIADPFPPSLRPCDLHTEISMIESELY